MKFVIKFLTIIKPLINPKLLIKSVFKGATIIKEGQAKLTQAESKPVQEDMVDEMNRAIDVEKATVDLDNSITHIIVSYVTLIVAAIVLERMGFDSEFIINLLTSTKD